VIEMVFQSPDFATLEADALRLGFTDEDGKILTNGATADGGGWFLNLVGTVYQPTGNMVKDALGNMVPEMAPIDGYWGRLRVNGGAENLPPFDPSIIKYHWSPDVGPVNPETEKPSGGWTSDGVTLAPDFVANVGVIA
jgi:hypothetical protein